MSRNPVEQHPDEYRQDLNPDYEEGENHPPRRYETRSAYDIKPVHERLRSLRDDELKQIPVLDSGSRLEQGAVYLDLKHPEQGEFQAMGNMMAGPENWYVPKSDTDHELWNRLTGVQDPYRLGARGPLE